MCCKNDGVDQITSFVPCSCQNTHCEHNTYDKLMNMQQNKVSHLITPTVYCVIMTGTVLIYLAIIVYVEWASRVNFVTIFGDLYQNKLWVICNNLNQFAHLSSASCPSNDVIKMAAIVLPLYTYKTSYLKQ